MECIISSHIHNVERTRMEKRGDITTHDMFILNRTCHPSYDSHTENACIRHVASNREDGIHGIDHSINPHILVMRHSTRMKHVAYGAGN
jgi:hypothetical protein